MKLLLWIAFGLELALAAYIETKRGAAGCVSGFVDFLGPPPDAYLYWCARGWPVRVNALIPIIMLATASAIAFIYIRAYRRKL